MSLCQGLLGIANQKSIDWGLNSFQLIPPKLNVYLGTYVEGGIANLRNIHYVVMVSCQNQILDSTHSTINFLQILQYT